MEQLQPWITPALVLGLFAWVRFMFRDLKDNMNGRIDDLKTEMNSLKADMNRRYNRKLWIGGVKQVAYPSS